MKRGVRMGHQREVKCGRLNRKDAETFSVRRAASD